MILKIYIQILNFFIIKNPFSISYCVKSHLEQDLPSRCHQYIGKDCKECFEEEKKKLKSKKYDFFNETNEENKKWVKELKTNRKEQKLLAT